MKNIASILFFYIFSLVGISGQNIINENFEYDGTGEDPLDHCDELGSFLINGYYSDWGSYNQFPVYVEEKCPDDPEYGIFLDNFTGTGYEKFAYYALGHNSICLAERAWSKYDPILNKVSNPVGLGIFYNNPEKLYLGTAQKYIVNFDMVMPIGINYPIFGNLIFGYRDAGNEIPNNSSIETPEYNYYYPDGNNSEEDGIYGIVTPYHDLQNPETWYSYKARVRNSSSFSNAYQLIIAFDEFIYNNSEQLPNNSLFALPSVVFLDNIKVECDPKQIFVEVKEMVSETIDETNCTKTRRYRVNTRYDNCSVDFSKLFYNVELTDNLNNVISTFIGHGEYFDVTYSINTYSEVNIYVESTNETKVNGYYFFKYFDDPSGPMDFYYAWQDKDILWENSGNDIVVENGENIVWDDNLKILGSDIIINSGGALTIKTNVFMASDKVIWVQKGGTLIVDGGKITSCSEKWYGIVIVGDPTQPQSNTAAHGKVITMNNAKIENAEVGIGNYFYPWSGLSGGIIECSNTEFNNCNYGILFLPFSKINTNFVHNCKFINGTYGIINIGTKGIEFHTNSFENLERGIWATDSKFEVRYGNIFRNINESGILATATSPGLTSALINDDNQFWNCQYGIALEGNTASDNHEIIHNYFDNCWFSIDINGDNNYRVLENRFNDCAYGVESWASGGEVNNVDCNIFQRTLYGNIYMLYSNSQSSFMGNDFIESGAGPYKFDFRLYNGEIDENIGALNQPAMNYFSSHDDIETENSEAFKYWKPDPPVVRTDPQNPGNYIEDISTNANILPCQEAPVPEITDVQIRQYKLNYCYWLMMYRSNPRNPYYKKMFLEARKQFHLAYYYWSIQNEKNLTWQKTDSLLSTMCGDIWKVKRYGLQMYHGDLTQAETILNELADQRLAEPPLVPEDLSDESRASFITTQRINLKYQAGKGSYKVSDAELNILRVEGLKNIPERAYARGLYTLVTGDKIPVELPLEENPIYPRESSDDSEFWSFSPNPANDVMQIAFAGKGTIEGKVTVYNVDGRNMLERLINYKGKSETLLDVSSLIDGMYVITIKDKDENVIKTQKLIICKNK